MTSVYVIVIPETRAVCWGAFSTLELAENTIAKENLYPCQIEEWEIDGGFKNTFYFNKENQILSKEPIKFYSFKNLIRLFLGE